MSLITEKFAELRGRGERALIPYLTAGFPAGENTVPLLLSLERGGADIIELGIPFSDPLADGPTIQRASSAALAAGATLPGALEMLRQFRKAGGKAPVVLFGAYNPFFKYGMEKFARDAREAGADGVLIADLPADEADEAAPILEREGLDLICLVAPTSGAERKRMICSHGRGFIYYISLKGVTGARADARFELERVMEELHGCTDLPVAVGFGISTPEQAAKAGMAADGVVVGSALIDLIFEHADAPDLARRVEEYMREMKGALPAAPAPAVS